MMAPEDKRRNLKNVEFVCVVPTLGRGRVRRRTSKLICKSLDQNQSHARNRHFFLPLGRSDKLKKTDGEIQRMRNLEREREMSCYIVGHGRRSYLR